MDSPYLELTSEFNRGGLRVLLSSGLQRYETAAAVRASAWTAIQREIASLPLLAAHPVLSGALRTKSSNMLWRIDLRLSHDGRIVTTSDRRTSFTTLP